MGASFAMKEWASRGRGGPRVRAVIVGAGIGGLGAAIALERAGVEPSVIEHAPELQEAGFGLVLSANAIAALRSLGLRESVAARGRRRQNGSGASRAARPSRDGRESPPRLAPAPQARGPSRPGRP
jgi:2-polyprenyl-6-methoxyphenol hydroxylase-like FAD-dependent oxidoreductase